MIAGRWPCFSPKVNHRVGISTTMPCVSAIPDARMGRGDSLSGVLMLAILGLIGVAISALVVIDVNSDEDDLIADEEGTLGTQSAPPPTVSLADIVYADELDTDDEASSFSGGGDNQIAGGASGGFLGDDAVDDMGDGVAAGAPADDLLLGRMEDDTLLGDAQNNILQGGGGDDHLIGGDGDDVLQGDLGNDHLTGGDGADSLLGGAGDDLLDGRDDGAQDVLFGGAGDDRLVAGFGDYLNGGDGADVFVLEDNADGYVADFHETDDLLEVIYEGDTPPTLTTAETEDGLAVMADGEVVAVLGGLKSLDLGRVMLVAA